MPWRETTPVRERLELLLGRFDERELRLYGAYPKNKRVEVPPVSSV